MIYQYISYNIITVFIPVFSPQLLAVFRSLQLQCLRHGLLQLRQRLVHRGAAFQAPLVAAQAAAQASLFGLEVLKLQPGNSKRNEAGISASKLTRE